MKNNYLKYLWILPALYVSYEFGNKLFEVLSDPLEIMDIISVIKPFANMSNLLAHLVGYFDLVIAISLILIPSLIYTKKYSEYIFMWVIIWPFIPASFRYFGGVGDFEIVQVLSISISAIVSYLLYVKYNKINYSRFSHN